MCIMYAYNFSRSLSMAKESYYWERMGCEKIHNYNRNGNDDKFRVFDKNQDILTNFVHRSTFGSDEMFLTCVVTPLIKQYNIGIKSLYYWKSSKEFEKSVAPNDLAQMSIHHPCVNVPLQDRTTIDKWCVLFRYVTV